MFANIFSNCYTIIELFRGSHEQQTPNDPAIDFHWMISSCPGKLIGQIFQQVTPIIVCVVANGCLFQPDEMLWSS